MKPKSFDDLYREAETHDDYWIAGAIHDFTEEICRLMELRKIHRTELARRLGSSPAYVTKILRGNANFTVATMVKIARALDARLDFRLRESSASEEQEDEHEEVTRGGSRESELRVVPLAAKPAE